MIGKTDPAGRVEEVYARYGFRRLPLQKTSTLVFEQNFAGRHMADIVSVGEAPSRLETLKHDLERSGYSCRIRLSADPAILDHTLFSEFFAFSSSRQRVIDLYEDYCRKQTVATGSQYSYRPIRYVSDSGPARPGDDLVDRVCSIATSRQPRLVIIEAAAGFGKTCTAYEIANKLASSDISSLPLLAELSRNRTATIFRYILLDELERNFPTVRSDLARYQIQEGRLIVLLDGFDELLYKPGLRKPTFEDAETMLETIRDLLTGDACVLITSRKSTLLSGDSFQEWLDSHTGQFRVHRFLLDKPDPRVWLSGERRDLLSRSGLLLKQLANPVLFSFLDSLQGEELRSFCEQPERIVDGYLLRILSREKDRQQLLMEPAEQREIFKRIAGEMLKDNFKAERRSFFEDFIRDNFQSLLVAALRRYPKGSQTDFTELIDKLLLHALFDRRLESRGLLGFQNDFLLGTFVAENIIDANEQEWVGSEEFVDLAVTAYEFAPEEERVRLWQCLQFMAAFLPDNLVLDLDALLIREVRRDFATATFSDLDIKDVEFGRDYSLRDCCFVNCRLTRVKFHHSRISGLTFINCHFDNCFVGGQWQGIERVVLFECVSSPPSFIEEFSMPVASVRRVESDGDGDQYDRVVLENFWPPGRPNFSKRRAIRTLYLGRSHGEHDKVAEAIKSLRQNGLIQVAGDHADLNLERLDEIMQCLGRR